MKKNFIKCTEFDKEDHMSLHTVSEKTMGCHHIEKISQKENSLKKYDSSEFLELKQAL